MKLFVLLFSVFPLVAGAAELPLRSYDCGVTFREYKGRHFVKETRVGGIVAGYVDRQSGGIQNASLESAIGRIVTGVQVANITTIDKQVESMEVTFLDYEPSESGFPKKIYSQASFRSVEAELPSRFELLLPDHESGDARVAITLDCRVK